MNMKAPASPFSPVSENLGATAQGVASPGTTPAMLKSDAKPLLDAVVAAICLDASHDSLRFALRSDTGHDGE